MFASIGEGMEAIAYFDPADSSELYITNGKGLCIGMLYGDKCN